MSLIVRSYGDFGGFGRFWVAKNKANQSQLFSPQILWGLKNLFEKTKPIYFVLRTV